MKLTRRQFMAGTATTVIAPASLAPSTKTGTFSSWSEPSNAITHSGGRLSWIVTVEDGKLESLRKRLDGSDAEISEGSDHEETGTATVVATPEYMGARARDQWTRSGLAFASYVRSVELNRTLSMVEPIDPEGKSAWNPPSGFAQRFIGLSELDTPGDGVAFDGDMQESTLLDVRRDTEATESDLGEYPDTSGLTAAVIDTGVNDGGVFDGADGTRILETSRNVIDDETGVDAPEDDDGHGTWCASCIASGSSDDRYRGFLPEASVLAIKALSDGGGTIDDIAAGIRYAADERADLICMSLGSPMHSTTIADALEYAIEMGCVPVAAAGNDRQLSRWLATPASDDHTIAVGATTVAEPDEALSAYFSNISPHNGITDDSGGATTGAEIDVGAPGCKITAETPRTRGSATLSTLTGTSMATPVTVGIAGLYLADNPRDDFEEVRDRLKETAVPIPKAAQEEVGAGMPNARTIIGGYEPEEPQSKAMTDEAAGRGVAYNQISGSNRAKLLIELGLL